MSHWRTAQSHGPHIVGEPGRLDGLDASPRGFVAASWPPPHLQHAVLEEKPWNLGAAKSLRLRWLSGSSLEQEAA